MATVGKPATETEYNVKENQVEEKKRELLKSLEEQVNEVDRNVTQFAESFDSLFKKLRSGSDDFEKDAVQQDQDRDDEDKHTFSKTRASMSNLIELAERVDKIKVKAIKSLSKLIHFVHADREEISTNQLPASCEVLNIDNYLNDCRSSDENGDTLIAMLQEQNKRLQQKYMLSREHAKIIGEREKLVNDDRKHLSEQLNILKSKMKTQISTTSAHDKFTCYNEHFAEDKHMVGSHEIQQECVESKNDVYDSDNTSHTAGDSATTTCVTDESTVPENDMVSKIDGYDGGIGSVTKQNYSDVENELIEAKQQISSLQASLQIVETSMAEIKDLSQALVFRNFSEVALVHTREVLCYYPERDLEHFLKTALEKRRPAYDLKVIRGTSIAQHDTVSLICCAASSSKDWDYVIKQALSNSIDYNLTFVLLLYEYFGDGRKLCEEAQKRNCQLLGKCVRTFTIPHLYEGKLCSLHRNELIEEIITAITKKAVHKRKVVGCIHCSSPYSTA